MYNLIGGVIVAAAVIIVSYGIIEKIWKKYKFPLSRKEKIPESSFSIDALSQEIISISDEVEHLHLLENNPRFRTIIATIADHDPSGEIATKWLENASFGLRFAAIEIFVHLKKRDACAKIRRHVSDESGWVAFVAANALEGFSDFDSIPAFLKTLPHVAQFNFMYSRWLAILDALLSKIDEAKLDEILSIMSDPVRSQTTEFLSPMRNDLEPNMRALLTSLEEQGKAVVEDRTLEKFGRNLSALAEQGLLPYAFYVDSTIKDLKNRLAREGNRCFVLVGPSGVGKTAIIHELVHHMRRMEQEPLVFLEATTSDIMAGTMWVGQWQTKLKQLIEYLGAPRPVIWYIPDINNVLTAGTSAHGGESFSDLIMPHIEKGNLTIIGECTPEAYHRGIESYPPLRRLLACIRVNEPHQEESSKILIAARDMLVGRYQAEDLEIELNDQILREISNMADRYYPGVSMPGRAVEILKEVVKSTIERSSGEERPPKIEITREEVIRTLAKGTGIPAMMLDDSISLDTEALTDFFQGRIKGQEDAIRAVADRIVLIKSGLTDPTRPLGVFFFVGPTGVGKTEMAKALATYLFGSPDRLLRLDMSEFKDYHSFEKLIGNPREPLSRSSLVAKIHQQPFSVLLLDELEKAHPNIYDLFLQVFDDGRLTDAHGNFGDFRQALIIMTSNIGGRAWTHSKPGFQERGRVSPSESVTEEIKEFFRPEFINRIDKFVLFNPLDFESMRSIAEQEIRELLDRSGIEGRDLLIEVSPSVLSLLLRKGFSSIYGARPLKRAVEELVAMPLARWIVSTGGREEMLLISAREHTVQIQALSIEDEREEKEETEKSLLMTTPERPGGSVMTLEQAIPTAREMSDRIGSFEEKFENLKDRKSELLAHSRRGDFWTDRSSAIGVLSEIHHIEQLEDILGRVRKRTDDLVVALELARKKGGGDFLAEAQTRSSEITREMDLLETASICQDPRDRCDTFISLTLAEKGQAGVDFVEMLSEMYRGWAIERGFQAETVFDSQSKGGNTISATIRIDGLYAYGILRGESGLHVSQWMKKGELRTRTIVRTDILHIPDDMDVRDSEILIRKKSQAGGAEAPGTTALHLPTMIMAEADENVVRDLLSAKVAAMREPTGPGDELRIVRRYRFESSPMVRDEDTGLKSGRLNSILKGEIDHFLMERLRRRPG